MPNLKGVHQIYFQLSGLKRNLCGGGGGSMTVIKPKYPLPLVQGYNNRSTVHEEIVETTYTWTISKATNKTNSRLIVLHLVKYTDFIKFVLR